MHASYTTGGRAQGGIGWGQGKHRCGGEGPGRILWGPVTIRRSQGTGEASNLTWPCPRQRSSGPHHSCEEHTCWRHFLSEVWKMSAPKVTRHSHLEAPGQPKPRPGSSRITAPWPYPPAGAGCSLFPAPPASELRPLLATGPDPAGTPSPHLPMQPAPTISISGEGWHTGGETGGRAAQTTWPDTAEDRDARPMAALAVVLGKVIPLNRAMSLRG